MMSETVPLERNLDLLSYTKRCILVRKKRHGCMLMLRSDIQDKAVEEQRRINEELVGRIQILEFDCTEYNAKVDFLMQQISRRGPSTDNSSLYVSSLGNKRLELFDMGAGASDPTADGNVQMASGPASLRQFEA